MLDTRQAIRCVPPCGLPPQLVGTQLYRLLVKRQYLRGPAFGAQVAEQDVGIQRDHVARWFRALAASNPAAAKDYVPAIEAQRAEALSRHLAGIAPGLNATNDQVIDYMGKSAQARARLGEVMSPDQLQTAQKQVAMMKSEGYTAALQAAQRGDLAEANRLWAQSGSIGGALTDLKPAKMSEQYGGLASFEATYTDSKGATRKVNVGDMLAQAEDLKARVEMSTKVVAAAAQRESAAAQTKNAATNALEVPIKQQQANAATTQAAAAVTSAGAHVTTANTGKAAQASTAGVNQATAKHLGAQTAGLQQDQDTTTALGTPAGKRTEAQNVLAAAAEAKLAAKQNTPEKLSAARRSAETYTEKIMRAGKGAMDSFSPEEMANMRATMMASGELAALAQANGAGRNIDESSNHNAALKAVAEGRVLLQTGAVNGSLEEATMAAIRRSGGAVKRGPADGLSPPAAGASVPAAAGAGARGGANTNYSHLYR